MYRRTNTRTRSKCGGIRRRASLKPRRNTRGGEIEERQQRHLLTGDVLPTRQWRAVAELLRPSMRLTKAAATSILAHSRNLTKSPQSTGLLIGFTSRVARVACRRHFRRPRSRLSKRRSKRQCDVSEGCILRGKKEMDAQGRRQRRSKTCCSQNCVQRKVPMACRTAQQTH